MNEFQNLINLGKHRDAIKYAKNTAADLLIQAADLHSKSYDEKPETVNILESALFISNDPRIYAKLTEIYNRLHQFENTIQIADKCKNPTFDIFFNHAKALTKVGKHKEAIPLFRKSLELQDNPVTHFELSNALLVNGEFAEGQRENLWRFKACFFAKKVRNLYNAPDWTDEKRVLVFNEQGLGDAIQYLRYIKLLRQKAYVILEIQESLAGLFKDHVDELVPRPAYLTSNLPPSSAANYDAVMSILSLPVFFDPNLDNISLTPYLKAEGNIDFGPGFKVGIVWAGHKWHEDDQKRSCPLNYFDVLQLPNIRFYSLQVGPMVRSWDQGDDALVVDLKNGSKLDYVDLSDKLTDFSQTALILSKLDLLLTVDTSVAHLAGAMGLPVWLLLPYAHDWRWQKQWYPGMTIFKQKTQGDWGELMTRVKNNLLKYSNKL